MTLDSTIVDEAKRRLQAGATCRGVVRAMEGRLSRQTACNIAQWLRAGGLGDLGTGNGLKQKPVGRCPTCGRRVELPCRPCEVAQLGGPMRVGDEDEPTELRLELHGAMEKRYRELHAMKLFGINKEVTP